MDAGLTTCLHCSHLLARSSWRSAPGAKGPERSEPRVQLACPRVARLTVCSRSKTSLDTSVSYSKQHRSHAYSVHPKHTHRDLSIAAPGRSGRSRLPPVPPKMALPRGVQDAGDAAPQPLSRPRATNNERTGARRTKATVARDTEQAKLCT